MSLVVDKKNGHQQNKSCAGQRHPVPTDPPQARLGEGSGVHQILSKLGNTYSPAVLGASKGKGPIWHSVSFQHISAIAKPKKNILYQTLKSNKLLASFNSCRFCARTPHGIPQHKHLLPSKHEPIFLLGPQQYPDRNQGIFCEGIETTLGSKVHVRFHKHILSVMEPELTWHGQAWDGAILQICTLPNGHIGGQVVDLAVRSLSSELSEVVLLWPEWACGITRMSNITDDGTSCYGVFCIT